MTNTDLLDKAMRAAGQRTRNKRSNSPCPDCAGMKHDGLCDRCELPNHLRVSEARRKGGEWRERWEL